MINPFKVLGLDPSVLQGLTDPQIQILVKGAHRSLASIHHEDVTGRDNKKIRQVNEARDQLSDDVRFRYWKIRFLKSRKDRLADFEDELALKETEVCGIQDQFLRFWSAFADIENKDHVSVFNLVPMRILITNSMAMSIDTREILSRERNFYSLSSRDQSLMRACEVDVDKEGHLWTCKTQRVYFNHLKQKAPDLPDKWLYKSDAQPSFSYYIERKGRRRKLAGMRLIGTINKDDIGWGDVGVRNFDALMPGKEEYKNADFGVGFPWELFRKYCRYIRPDIQTSTMLIGIIKSKENEELRYVVLGNILGIWIQ